MSKIDEIREVINHQSKVIKQLKDELHMVKLVLGYDEQKQKIDLFLEQMFDNGITEEDILSKPEMFQMAVKQIRKL